MKKILQQSEDSSFYRNEMTDTPEQQTRRGSYSIPSKRHIINQVFKFYTKQSYAIGVNATFDRQNLESNILTLAKFLHFCSDFNIKFLSKQELTEIFVKCSESKQMDCSQFEKLFSLLAYYKGCNLQQFYAELGFDNWNKNQKKMKQFCKPFHMKDDYERYHKDDIKYKFQLFHPEVKDQQFLKEILQKRKQQQIQQSQIEKGKKELIKLQYELKFLTKHQLYEKYPDKIDLIKKLPQIKIKQHQTYIKPTKINYSIIPNQQKKQSLQSNSIISWELLDRVEPNNELINQMIEQADENSQDDLYLADFQSSIQNQKPKCLKNNLSLFQEYGCLKSKRSKSDSLTKSIPRQNKLEISLLQYSENAKVDKFKKYFSPQKLQTEGIQMKNKFNLNNMKRANELKNLELIKEKQFLDMLILRKKAETVNDNYKQNQF